MTPASALSDLLICEASRSRSPLVCAAFCRSLPAKSIRWKAALRERTAAPPAARSARSIVSVKTLWLRLLSWFIAVAETRRFLAPAASSARAAATDVTGVSVSPSTYTPRALLSRSASEGASSPPDGASAHRSKMRSL